MASPLLCLLPLAFTVRHAPLVRRTPAPSMSATVDADKTYRTAQFWEEDSATLLDIANVLGRWETASEWANRTEFSVVQVAREENMAQSGSLERHEYARRNKLAERIALMQNGPKLPFKNERLAASLGKTVEEMNALPVNDVALGIVYDLLAESKSSMLPEKTIDARRSNLITADGGLNEGALAAGMFKSRIAVTTGFILLGKGQLYGVVLVGRVVLDATGAFDYVSGALGSYAEPLYWVLSLAVAAYAVQQSMEVTKRTSDFETMSKEEAEKLEAELQNDPKKATTVLGGRGMGSSSGD